MNQHRIPSDSLALVAIALALIGFVLWLVPVQLYGIGAPPEWQSAGNHLFTGLTDMGLDCFGPSGASTECKGRMPTFLVAEFTAVILLLIRR